MPRTELGVATTAFTITPSDTTNVEAQTRALYVGTSGDINVTMKDGGEVILQSVPQGTMLFLSFARVNNTDTGASNLVAFV